MGKNWIKYEPAKDRLKRKSIEVESGCVEYTGYIEPTGYGAIRYGGERYKAHRLSWIAHNGEIPDGLFVLHHCDNRKCVNISHLFLGTQYDNMQDMIKKGRKRPASGSGHGMAKLTDEQVIDIRNRVRCDGELQKNLAVEYGVSKQLISRIVRRDNWTHI